MCVIEKLDCDSCFYTTFVAMIKSFMVENLLFSELIFTHSSCILLFTIYRNSNIVDERCSLAVASLAQATLKYTNTDATRSKQVTV